MTLRIHMSIHNDDLHKTTAKRNLANGVAGLDGSGNVENTSGNDCETINNKDVVNGYEGLNSSNKMTLIHLPNPGFLSGTEILHSHDAEKGIPQDILTLQKTINLNYLPNATLRIYFELWTMYISDHVQGQIYRNGEAVGTLRQPPFDTAWHGYTENISGWAEGDTLELWCLAETAGYPDSFKVRNFRILVNIDELTNS